MLHVVSVLCAAVFIGSLLVASGALAADPEDGLDAAFPYLTLGSGAAMLLAALTLICSP